MSCSRTSVALRSPLCTQRGVAGPAKNERLASEVAVTEPAGLERRLQRLEDIEALRLLKHRYCVFCDAGYDAERLAPLFTEDAVWDGGAMGRFEGRAAIRKFFEGCSKLVPFAIHHVTNEVIEVNGDRARAEWLLWEPIVFAQGDQALWMAGRYVDRYQRVDGQWRFEHVTVELRMLSPYEVGFAKVRIAELPR